MFEPVHDGHAIEQFALVLQTGRQLDDQSLQGATKAAEQFRGELPGGQDLQAFALGIGSGAPIVPPNFSNQLHGRTLTRVRNDGTIEAELRIERFQLTFRTLAYTGWTTLWPRVRGYFEVLAPFYSPGGEMAGLSLNYVDKFYWNGDMAEMRPRDLLRPGSKYVIPDVYDARDLWHSHFGTFIRADGATKRLININLDCVDENRLGAPRRIVSITTLLTDMLNQPGYDPTHFANTALSLAFFCNRTEQLHIETKAVLATVLNEQMCKRIALVE